MIKNEILIFKDNDLELEVNVSPIEETVWLTQRQMDDLFEVSYDNINLHIKNIYSCEELKETSTSEVSSVVRLEGQRKVTRKIKSYNLDMIIAVGYRVNSKRGTTFRKWANSVLKEYMLKGFSIDKERLTLNSLNYTEFVDTVKMISSLVDRKELTLVESKNLLNIINKYSYALDTLDKYDIIFHRLTINKLK